MKKVVVFAGSNSSHSINKKLAVYSASQLSDAAVKVLDLNDFELPLFGVDLERRIGVPQKALDFLDELNEADGIIISLAEHNGAYSTAFKNLMDWSSRVNGKLWGMKPMLLMATSPGKRGGASVLQIASNRFPFMGGNIIETFSLPNFNENFVEGELVSTEYKSELFNKVKSFEKVLEEINVE